MFTRSLAPILQEYTRFPVVALLGPRQSGKTTLVKETFKNYIYTTLEDFKTRELAQGDPERFLQLHDNEHGLIIDEFQNVPTILSAIQVVADTKKRPGFFILTGSQNFLMNEAITQSLAGRVGILNLFPLSLHEMKTNGITCSSLETVMFQGAYPRIHAEQFPPSQLYPSYIQTYIERDVRTLKNIGDLAAFQKCLKLCAGRVGQLLNYSELATACGVSVPTIQRWISILEACYIVFRLQPYSNNFNRRLINHPKLYFYDTGLVCSLLDIESPSRLALDRLYGSIFENFIIADFYKQYASLAKRPPLYFWRDKNGSLEVDCVIENSNTLIPVEIKSGTSIALDFFTNLKRWNALVTSSGLNLGKSYIVYGGEKSQDADEWATLGWNACDTFVQSIRNEP